MAVPKRKSSKSRMRSRKASHKRAVPQPGVCPQCGAPRLPHRICPSCGMYRGRQVLNRSDDD